jgi:hypothetical protein
MHGVESFKIIDAQQVEVLTDFAVFSHLKHSDQEEGGGGGRGGGGGGGERRT